jgi:hypothetical protein
MLIPQKITHRVTTLREIKICPHKKLFMNVHRKVIHNSQKKNRNNPSIYQKLENK